jgi:23S rRNA (adenine2503-C2)-methyltransferase
LSEQTAAQQSGQDTRPSLLAAYLDGEDERAFPALLDALAGTTEKYRAAQIEKRLVSGIVSFDGMTELPAQLRDKLSSAYTLRETTVADAVTAEDGTVKLKIRLVDGAFIEAVLLSDSGGRRTVCLSTQTGCPAGCVFCKTGSIGFARNLRAAEIVEQFFYLREAASQSKTVVGAETISNIVVMGMGEPLLNLEALRRALLFLQKTGEDGRFSLRRVTVSSSGIVEGIRALPEKLSGARLALSLTTADEKLRRRLMPIARTNPLPALKEALRYYQNREKKRITLEAVLLGGINTRAEDAAALAVFARGLQVIVNLIPWNPVDGLSFEGQPLREPADGETERFAAMLHKHGLKTETRRRKGNSICGACGQLGGKDTAACVKE